MRFLGYGIIFISIYYITLTILRIWRFLNKVSDLGPVPPTPLPPDLTVTLLCPCKNTHKRLTTNINSLLRQTGVKYKVIFIVEAKKDPAYKVIKQKINKIKHARLIIAKKNPDKKYSGKVNNLLAGLEKVEENTSLVAFADSGCQYPKNWLYLLVKTLLTQPEIVATTTFFWSYPGKGIWSEVAAWTSNTFAIHRFLVPNSALLWGGAMCFRKKFLDQIDLKSTWKNVVYDDLTLSHIIRKKKETICFVPQAKAKREIEMNFENALAWFIRQMTAVKFYHTDWWKEIKKESIGLICAFLFPLWITLNWLSGLSIVGVTLSGSIVLFRVLNGFFLYRSFENQVSWRRLPKFFFLDILAIPFSLLVGIYTLRSQKIAWLGRKYHLSREGKIIKVKQYDK